MIMSCQGLTSRSGSVSKQTFVNIRKVKLHDLSGMKFTDDQTKVQNDGTIFALAK